MKPDVLRRTALLLDYHMPMRLPTAPAANAVKLRGDYSSANSDYVVEQSWGDYTSAEHALWGRLLQRQFRLIEKYGAPQVLAGLKALHIDRKSVV